MLYVLIILCAIYLCVWYYRSQVLPLTEIRESLRERIETIHGTPRARWYLNWYGPVIYAEKHEPMVWMAVCKEHSVTRFSRSLERAVLQTKKEVTERC